MVMYPLRCVTAFGPSFALILLNSSPPDQSRRGTDSWRCADSRRNSVAMFERDRAAAPPVSGTDRCSAYRRRPMRARASNPNSCRGNANEPSASGRYGFLCAVRAGLRQRRRVRLSQVTPVRAWIVRRLE